MTHDTRDPSVSWPVTSVTHDPWLTTTHQSLSFFPKISTEFWPSQGNLCLSEAVCSSLTTLLQRLWKVTIKQTVKITVSIAVAGFQWTRKSRVIPDDYSVNGSTGYGYWPVTHPNLLTHLTHEWPMTHCSAVYLVLSDGFATVTDGTLAASHTAFKRLVVRWLQVCHSTSSRRAFDVRSSAYQRSSRSQWRNTRAANPLAAVTMIYLFI